MDKKKRLQLLLDRRRRYEDRLLKAQEVMGNGSWHEDSSYEFAEQNIRLYRSYLDEVNEEIRKLKKDLDKGK